MSDEEAADVTQVIVPAPPAVRMPSRLAASDDSRAMASIKRAKGFGGLGGFAVTALAAHMHGELMQSILLRALAGGLVGYLVAWLAAVTVWRRIIRAELTSAHEQVLAARAGTRQVEQP